MTTVTAYERLLDALEAHGERVLRRGDRRAMAQCPAHDDREPSLSVLGIEGRVLINCHAGCDRQDVAAALGLAMRDLFDSPRGVEYHYPDGRTVRRTPDKRFTQSGNTKGNALYRADRVAEAVKAGEPVFVVEGEQDVHTLEAEGVVATCAPMGAGKWHRFDPSPLYGGKVLIIADNDEPGRRHAQDVLASLDGKADAAVFTARTGKDATDHVLAGHTIADFVPVDDQADPAAERYGREVEHEARRLRVRDDARALNDARKAGEVVIPPLVRLDEFLARPLDPVTHRIAGLWPVGGRVLLAAQWKAGKTTLRDNVVRSLVDGHPFLGVHEVHQPDGPVVVLDFELDPQTLQRWLADQQYEHPERVFVRALKGQASTFNILDAQLRDRWAQMLRTVRPSVIVVDCLRPILDALGLDENREAGRLLVALDELAAAAGARELLVVHHMGHTGERSRGDSRLRDWPDAEWRLVRDKDEEDPQQDDPAGARYFSAYGRDVDHPQAQLSYEPITRWLSITEGATTRKAAGDRRKTEQATAAVLEVITDQPGIHKRGLRAACRDHRGASVDEAVDRLVAQGRVRVVVQGQAHFHYLADTERVPRVPPCPDTPDTTVSRVSIGTRDADVHTAKINNQAEPDTVPASLQPTECQRCHERLLLLDGRTICEGCRIAEDRAAVAM